MIYAYLTGFVIGAAWVLLLMGVRERRFRREQEAEIARLTHGVPVAPESPRETTYGGVPYSELSAFDKEKVNQGYMDPDSDPADGVRGTFNDQGANHE